MRISGMNPRQWSLAKESSLKVENDSPKMPKQAEVKRGVGFWPWSLLQKTLSPHYCHCTASPTCEMGTNCAPLLADIFLYSYEADLLLFIIILYSGRAIYKYTNII